jgi:O-antigen/teichoic acid export membrane protein
MVRKAGSASSRGDRVQRDVIFASAWRGSLVIGGVVAIAIAGLGLTLSGLTRAGWLAGALAIPCCQLLDLRIGHALAMQQPEKAARLTVLLTIAPVLGVLLGASWGPEVACLCGSGVLLLATVTTREFPPVQPRWSRSEGRPLLAAGWPLYLSIALDVSLTLMDRAVVGVMLGAEALGQLGVASSLAWAPFTLALAVGFYQLPLLVKAIGLQKESAKLVSMWGLRTAASVTVIVILMATAGIPAMQWGLPEYATASTAFVAFLPGVIARVAAYFPIQMLVARSKLRNLLVLQIGVVAFNLAGDIAALQLGYGLAGVGWATSAALIVYGLVSTILVMRHYLPRQLPVYLFSSGILVSGMAWLAWQVAPLNF